MYEDVSHFITDIIDEDLASGAVDHVQTRFPPEPNGCLHIGSAKAIWINYTMAKKYGGRFNLRYDDTNPVKEETEYVESIEEDLRWLGAVPDNIFYGSDYFDKCCEYAEKLIHDGKAYVCELSQEQVRETRGTLTEPGKNSPWRDRTPEENAALFERMKAGDFADGSMTLRAKIDMASPNINMRDPVIYRIVRAHHHRQGDKWCIYPMYDFAHPIQDAIEGITHSLCSLEFENHRPLYEWVIDNIGIPDDKKPKQREFARLNVTHTVMSKRYLRELVETGVVDGWDDPRMPTLCALRRRGYTPASIFDFIRRAGVAKADNLVDIRLLEHCIREELNVCAPRRIAVLDPLKLTIENFPADETEYFEISNNPGDADSGTRKVPFSKTLYIEKSDFALVPPPKFHRLTVGGEVRLMGSYIIKCIDCKTDENGEVCELICTADRETGCGNPADGRKIKGTVHWVSAAHALTREVRIYDNLFNIEDVSSVEEGKTYFDYLNPDSLKVYSDCKTEPALGELSGGDRVQLVRTGYFCCDIHNEAVLNRIVALKDSYKEQP